MPSNSILFRTNDVAVGRSMCSDVESNSSEEEVEPAYTIAFPLEGFYVVETRGINTHALPATALFFDQGQTHRVRHPIGGHDESAFLTLAPWVAEPFLDVSGSFRASSRPTTSAVDIAVRLILARAAADRLSSLQLEEDAFRLIAAIVEAPEGATVATGSRKALAASAEEYLFVHFRESCSLTGMANQIGASPHHLSRVFKEVTGETISRRRSRLRLNYALDRILQGDDDLTSVAIEAGFYDHAHMTNSFRSHFRMSPSEVRSDAGA